MNLIELQYVHNIPPVSILYNVITAVISASTASPCVLTGGFESCNHDMGPRLRIRILSDSTFFPTIPFFFNHKFSSFFTTNWFNITVIDFIT